MKFWVKKEGDSKAGSFFKNIFRIVVLIAAIAICWPFKVIGPTERGIVKTFGEVREVVLEPGLRFRIPIAQQITTYDLTPKTIRVNVLLGEDGAVSLDKQTIGVKGSVDWKYDDGQILNIAKRYSSTDQLASQTTNIIIASIKNIIGQYNIDIIVKDQDEIATKAKAMAASRLSSAGIPVIITALNLNNWDWSDDYDRMIKETVAMQQAAQKAAADLLRVEQSSQVQIKEAAAKAEAEAAAADGRRRAAELDAAAAIAKAKGLAEAKRLEGEGLAAYNRNIFQNFEVQKALWNYEVAKIRAEKLAPGTDVPLYIPLNPAGAPAMLQVPNQNQR
jgi:regulator of protease activity HflC (stomatin/prohibitin superfamily)